MKAHEISLNQRSWICSYLKTVYPDLSFDELFDAFEYLTLRKYVLLKALLFNRNYGNNNSLLLSEIEQIINKTNEHELTT